MHNEIAVGTTVRVSVHLSRPYLGLTRTPPTRQALDEEAIRKGETGLAIALGKPFQRLLKYPLLFQNLLFVSE